MNYAAGTPVCVCLRLEESGMRDILHYIWISLSGQAYAPFFPLPERHMNHHLDTMLRCNNKDICICVCLQVESEVMTLKS